MKITHDASVDAAYIFLVADIGVGGVARTVPVDACEIDGMINLDFDVAGRMVGIEVIGASRFLSPELLALAKP